jgi:hypothetical protein
MPLPPRVQEFHQTSWNYAVPLLFWKGKKIKTATCSVVEYDGHRYVISAAHVFLEALPAVQPEVHTDVMIGPLHLALTASSIRYVADKRALTEEEVAEIERIDVATLALTEEQVSEIERADYRIIRPSEWPLPTVAANDSIFMAGYPATSRLDVSSAEYEFGATTMGLIVKSVHPEEFIAHLDPAFGEPVSVGLEDVPPHDPGGCSGGPVFLVRDERALVPRLCGLVKEGLPPFCSDHLLLRFARLDVILGADGSVHRAGPKP